MLEAMINFHSNRRLIAEFCGDEESILPRKFMSEWGNRMKNGKSAFADVTGVT